MLSPFDSGGLQSPFGNGASLPYLSDDNTFVWNFTAADITVDETGTDSIADVPEMARGTSYSFKQPTKASQPLLNAEGAEFTSAGPLDMETVTGGTPTFNGSQGFYIAALYKMDAAAAGNQTQLKVYESVSTGRNGRFQAIPLSYGGHEARSYGVETDNNDFTDRIRPSVSAAYGTWRLHEWLHDIDGSTIRYWQDGVEDLSATLFTAYTGSTLDATDSLGMVVAPFMDGIVKAVSVYDQPIPDANRESISAYLMSIKP